MALKGPRGVAALWEHPAWSPELSLGSGVLSLAGHGRTNFPSPPGEVCSVSPATRVCVQICACPSWRRVPPRFAAFFFFFLNCSRIYLLYFAASFKYGFCCTRIRGIIVVLCSSLAWCFISRAKTLNLELSDLRLLAPFSKRAELLQTNHSSLGGPQFPQMLERKDYLAPSWARLHG